MQPIQASEIDLTHFSPVLADYGPKGILAKAVLVTKENIGKLALEFELDLQYVGFASTGTPFFKFMADRTADDPIELTVFAGFWVIELWEEIHIFRADIFENTFKVVVSSEPEQAESSVGRHTIGDPVTPRTASAGGPFKPIISAEEWEQARKDNRKKLEELHEAEGVEALRAKLDAREGYEETEGDVKLSEKLLKSGIVENPYSVQGNPPTGVSVETPERPPWIPNDAVPMVEVATEKDVWVRPEAYEDLTEDARQLFRPREKDVEKTEIVPSVGELDTDESNGKLD